MSDAAWIALFSALPAMLTALGSLLLVLRKLWVVEAKLEVVHKATNSLTDRLVETTRAEALAAGVQQERDRTAPP